MPNSPSNSSLKRLHAIAASFGGSLHAQVFSGWDASYLCECAAGHRWTARGVSLIQGKWCRRCFYARRRKATEEAFRAKAESLGGLVLDVEYRGSQERHRLRCKEGHEWMATPNYIQRGFWCPVCRKTEPQKG